ncbi:MAG TPA: uroporphyrinogen decarboxylase family protein [Feifaniaceae bacterium]|nr:uroporphyrinogen decarboxylase family protein [Feifaniaceae bacterium]
MNKTERIKAALRGEAVDRVPVNLWMHFSTVDQDPRSLAETQAAFAKKYDFDFIKLMPFGLYGVQDYGAKVKIFNQVNLPPIVDDYGVHSISDWGDIGPLPAHYGTYGKQVQLARYALKLANKNLPVIQTIFSPLTTARKLAGDRILLDMKEDPKLFKQALQAITETTVNFVKANLEEGIDGFFFATQCANHDFLTVEEYREFGEYFDVQVINAYRDRTYFNVAHIHGDNGMFELIANYPVNCINWHDRWSSPTLSEARTLTKKCLLGGIREVPYYDASGNRIRGSLLNDGTVEEVEQHVREAVSAVGGRGLILGPGCVADQKVPEKSLYALRRAVEPDAAGQAVS